VPRFSRTPASVSRPPAPAGTDADEALGDWGVDEGRIASLRKAGAID
jgi:alpha-methylacyl-CoA racemase